nr:hypothetical protein [Gottschalkia acidurici]
MDIMTLKEILIVGVPEVFIVILIGLVLGFSNDFFKQIRLWGLKLFISVMFILIGIYFIRSRATSIQSISIFCLITYIASYKFIFEMNTRKSIIIGSIVMFLILSSEIVTFPVLKYIENGVYFKNRINVTIITRVIQIIILVLFYKANMHISNINMISCKWRDLKIKEKITIVFIISLLVLCVIFNASYSDLYVKLNISNLKLEDSYIRLNMFMYFMENILFIFIVLYLLNRTKNYYIFEEFLLQGDEAILRDLLELADEERIREYKKICDQYLEELDIPNRVTE